MTTRKTIPLDLAAARERLEAGGEPLWRGLDELAQSEALREMLHREFPDQASEWGDPVTRRRFLALAGASIALAGGLSGCQQAPPEKIVPYVKQPEQIVPGKPLFFATAMALGGTAVGLLIESHEGRPTKVEGNPSHPASLGATDVFAQAAVLGLYDPDRSGSVTFLGRPRGWGAASVELRKALGEQRARKGAGLRVLTGTVASPTLADQLERAIKDYPEAKWIQYDPLASDNGAEGARLAFGRPVNTYYDLTKADVIVSLDADFLSCGQGGASLRYSRQYAARRKVWQEKAPEMNRLYVVEGTPSVTGSVADHHIRARAGLVESFARALAAELHKGVNGDTALADVVLLEAGLPNEATKAVGPIARDLLAHRGRCVVLAGYAQPPAVHALAHAMNRALANVSQSVFHTDPIIPPPADDKVAKRATHGPGGLRELVADMKGGAVEALFILGANPVYTAPADLDFRAALEGLSRRKALTVHHGLYQDETAEFCQWHVPETHFLESWGDARAFNGVVSVVQPLISPLFGGRSAHDMLELFGEGTQRLPYEIVRAYWAARRPKGDGSFEDFWQRTLNDGVMAGTELPHKPAALSDGWSAHNLAVSGAVAAAPDNLEIVFRPDPTLYDGRFANNGWLQELPRPLSRLTWDNAAFVSPATAEKLGVASDFKLGWHGGEHGRTFAPLVEITHLGRAERFPLWIMPGHADDAVTLHLGGGRTRAGHVGNSDGRHNAYRLRTADLPWLFSGGRLTKTGDEFVLACVQAHHSIENNVADQQTAARHIVRTTTLGKFTADPHSATRVEGEREGEQIGRLPLTLYGDEWQYPRYRWGMAIDLSSCTGCSACVIACQAENNIPVVGKEEVTRGREMHWLRVDRFYAGGGIDNPQTFHQPVPCMQCENAPCELVCPVAATAHSSDGLNDMTYNRCVGTRYCSNNCPYKVRRFNFLYYSKELFQVPTLKLLSNPDVTVRSRGVMEKCTYCVQRIRGAEIEAEKRGVRSGGKDDGRVRDGEVLTACQAVCPAEAIVFGDINDKNSRVYGMKMTPLNYGVLAELNTRPRTTYLAAVRNPNPEMAT
jgi:molybdopterin-containing oxidoreductase family iron-sulfur binding subunit